MKVCVFAASSSLVDGEYIKAACELGRLLAVPGSEVIYGGGGIGLMGHFADSVIKYGGKITGVIPRFMIEEGWGHTGLTDIIVTDDMSERKKLMIGNSDAIVALPGGIGTLEELTEAITLKQLGLYRGPIIILNTFNFYDSLLEFLNKMISGNFMRKEHASMWLVARSPDEVITLIKNYNGWFDNPRKFAKIY